MTIKEQIHAEIDSLDDDALQELYQVVKMLAEMRQSPTKSRPTQGKETLIGKLKSISIDGPEDLAINHDNYVLGQNGG